ncbi:MAG: hypothetical protein QOJ28_24 [Mycobacterium sp.]|nr:hypothetical protein [Mycobacterium sp.]
MVIPISEHGDGAAHGPRRRRSCARHGVFAESPKVNPLIP